MDFNFKEATRDNGLNEVAIVFHTGSGSTKTICEIIKEKIAVFCSVDLYNIFDINSNILNNYRVIVLGFPTFHCQPSKSINEFVDKLPVFSDIKNTILLTTYGLYSGNSIKIIAKKLLLKNLKTVDSIGIRVPAGDGVLITPALLTIMLRYEKSLPSKLATIEESIQKCLSSEAEKMNLKMPKSKWYVPFSNILGIIGEKRYEIYKKNIYINRNKCINCGLCVKNCGRGCWSHKSTGESSIDNIPVFNYSNCEFCLRCVHKCPQKAITFRNTIEKKLRLKDEFYNKLRRDYFS